MTPSELIAWHAHQITFLPATDNAMVKHHRDAMHCVERLRAERDELLKLLVECRDSDLDDYFGEDMFARISAAIEAAMKP